MRRTLPRTKSNFLSIAFSQRINSSHPNLMNTTDAYLLSYSIFGKLILIRSRFVEKWISPNIVHNVLKILFSSTATKLCSLRKINRRLAKHSNFVLLFDITHLISYTRIMVLDVYGNIYQMLKVFFHLFVISQTISKFIIIFVFVAKQFKTILA